MTLLLHAISLVDPPTCADSLRGLRGEPLRPLSTDLLTAYLSEVSALERDDLLAHHRIVSELHATTDGCLPARFPTRFETCDAVRAVLERRAAEFVSALERIRGRVELAITVLAQIGPPDDKAVTPGTRYLRARLRTSRAAQDIAAEIRTRIGEHGIEINEVRAPREGVLLSMAVLVARADADALAERLRANRPERQDVRILVNGPWPPYTFAVVQAREA